MQEVELRTGVWYNDHPVKLTFPDSWDVVTHWPQTPPPLTDKEIMDKMNSPIGQPPLRELAKGKKTPVIIIDDLARPTPVFKVMPLIIDELGEAFIQPHDIRILVATGTHGRQDEKALSNKVGKEIMKSCRIIVHNDQIGTKYIGKTSFGTPVHVNSELLKSDLVIGIGGVYPQHSTGFGGGSKLSLGVLGRRTIRRLHYRHQGVGGTYNHDNDFRKDLTEIARMIRLNSIYTLHINAFQELVNIICGDHFSYYPTAAKFSKAHYTAPLPSDADAVIVNTYPSDISYTFMRKAMKPIQCAPRNATRIAVASNHEGLGTHGLFPQGKTTRMGQYKVLYRRISTMSTREIITKIIKNVLRQNGSTSNEPAQEYSTINKSEKTLWIFRTDSGAAAIPQIRGVSMLESWEEILTVIKEEHPFNNNLKIRIYPCGSLQCLDNKQ